MDISVNSDFLTLLQNTGTVARVVLLILLGFSIWSWGIILSKSVWLKTASRNSKKFWKAFHEGRSLSQISLATKGLRFSPLVPVFAAGYNAIQTRNKLEESGGGVAVRTPSLTNVQRAMQRAASNQLTVLERHMTFLATTASVAPFVGLFGTVWGVMTAFMEMGRTDSATLRAVAPGISEALIATAFGLFAAIPAVIAYNQFLHRIRITTRDIDDLQAEMLAIAETSEI
jgi:biopolymer transport protein TolQ